VARIPNSAAARPPHLAGCEHLAALGHPIIGRPMTARSAANIKILIAAETPSHAVTRSD